MKTGFLAVLLVGAISARPARAESASASVGLEGAKASGSGASVPESTGSRFDAPVELGFLGGLFLPAKEATLHGADYAPDPLKSPAPEIGGRAAYLPVRYLGLELEGAVMPAKTESGEHGGFFTVRGHALLQYPMGSFAPFVVGGIGRLGSGSTNTGTGIGLAGHFGIGAKLALDDFVALRLDLRDTLSDKESGSGTAMSPEVLLGLSFRIGAGKKAPEAAPPPPKVDTDGDGKTDDVDACPKVAATTADGCPPPDTDLDGFTDDKDACPNEVGKLPCGCPLRDADGDKVIDELDKCPNEPGPIEGCPDPDADRDGVPLPADKCPDQQETKNGYEDGDGCPDEVPEKVKKFTGVIQGIEFDRAKDTIRPVSAPTLDGAVAVLNEYPALRILISGHTDTDGDRAVNMDLSKRRADSVKGYFVSKGIAADRIETVGMGPDQPIADNKTAAGRQKNRRIEFKLLAEAASADSKPAAQPVIPDPQKKPDAKPPEKSEAKPEGASAAPPATKPADSMPAPSTVAPAGGK
ncbi:MAG TPA: OmpA family protein [Polyangiaceae bacterium]|nr:OmpA family protein [Polyangiaceae bacterium]